MKSCKKFIFLFCILVGAKICAAHSEEKVFLLSFPRSGNTWMRYCMEYCTKRPSREPLKVLYRHRHIVNVPLGYYFPLGTDFAKPPIVKCHNINAMYSEEDNPQDHLLILIVRNCFESLVRQIGMSMEDMLSFIREEKSYSFKYFDNIRSYLDWPEESRLLIYYEDFITNPEQELKRICSFLGESQEHIASFMKKYNHHRNSSAAFYSKHVSTTLSYKKPNELLYHSYSLSAEKIKLIQEEIEIHHSECLPILHRYMR